VELLIIVDKRDKVDVEEQMFIIGVSTASSLWERRKGGEAKS